MPAAAAPVATAAKAWPAGLPEQAAALRDLLAGLAAPADARALAAAFEGRATPRRLAEIESLLAMLAALGQAEEVAPGRWKR